MGRIGTIGVVRFRPEGCWVNNNAMAVVATSDTVDPFYLHLLLEQFDWDTVTAGTAQPFVRKTDLLGAELVLPPLEDQRRIAEVLGALDDAIEVSRSLIESLEASILLEAAAVLQSAGEETQLLTDVATIVNGYSYKSSELVEDSDTAMVNLKSFGRYGGFRLDGLKPFDGTPKTAQMLISGDAMVAKTDLTQDAEVIGRCLRMPALPQFESYVASLDIAIVRSKGQLPQLALCALLGQPEFRDHCLGFVNGTTVLHMSKAALETYSMPLLDDGKVAELTTRVEALAAHQDRVLVELYHLQEMHDFLLPRLVSGELRVAAAEELVEAAT
jgi:type I restriction enzyme S subunit